MNTQILIIGVIIAAAIAAAFYFKEGYQSPKRKYYRTQKQTGDALIQDYVGMDFSDQNKVVDIGNMWKRDWAPRPQWYQHHEPRELVL